MTTEPNTRQLIARAAAGLPAPFTPAQLVVATWLLAPERMGLAGYSDLYPDSNKVLSALWGRKGLVGQGQIVRDGAGFCLSDAGRALLPPALPPAMPVPPLPAALHLATGSVAYAKFNGGRKDTIDFTDALYFWSAERGAVGEYVAEIEALLAGRDTPELRTIGACHDYLTGRFARRIGLSDGTAQEPKQRGRSKGKVGVFARADG